MAVVPPLIGSCESVQDEFWYHVSPQSELPLAGGPTMPKSLVLVAGFLTNLNLHIRDGLDEAVQRLLVETPDALSGLRLLAGLSDKRMYLDLSYLLSRMPSPTASHATLCGCAPNKLTRHSTDFFVNQLKRPPSPLRAAISEAIAGYLLTSGLTRFAIALSALDASLRESLVLDFVASKEAQQSEAKRRGHGAEAAVAAMFNGLGVRIEPPDKAANPMGSYDPNFDPFEWERRERTPGQTFSADLAVLHPGGELAVCVQALIHSSDPGQFGVDKSNDTVAIRKLIDDGGRGELWGLVDGVGYSENKAGTINKLLVGFHEFAQLNSLYKFGLACHRFGLVSIAAMKFTELYAPGCAEAMIDRYVPNGVAILERKESSPEGTRAIQCGWATLFV